MNDLYLGFDTSSTEPLNFLEGRIYDLSPFAALEIEISGIRYKTAEHAYQALRVPQEFRKNITDTNSPLEAWREGQKCKEAGRVLAVNKDEIMEQVFRAKLNQHPYLTEILLATGNRKLIKVIPTDLYWGVDEKGEGENRMGRLWMKLRSELE